MDVFAALSDPVRRSILRHLANAETARVVDLTGQHHVTRPAISRHLLLLQQVGLVEAETAGRERHYRLTPAGLAPLHDYLSALAPGSSVPADEPADKSVAPPAEGTAES